MNDHAPIPGTGGPVLLFAMMKAVDINADSANANPSFAVGFTVTWHKTTNPDSGWNEVGGVDFRFKVPSATFDWTPFAAVFLPPEDAVGFSARM